MADPPQIHILMLLSAANQIPQREGGSHSTGIFLGELTEPAQALLDAGFTLHFVSPEGNAPTIDQNSYQLMYWGFSSKRLEEGKKIHKHLKTLGMSTPHALESLLDPIDQLDAYDGLFVPGGHAPMVDLLYKNWNESNAYHEKVGWMLKHFHDARKPTGLICHAPSILAAAPQENGKWIYGGYRMTTVTGFSEWLIEDFPLTRVTSGHLITYPTEILQKAGGVIKQTFVPMKSKVVEDRELITGQDPYSAKKIGQMFVNKILREKLKVRST